MKPLFVLMFIPLIVGCQNTEPTTVKNSHHIIDHPHSLTVAYQDEVIKFSYEETVELMENSSTFDSNDSRILDAQLLYILIGIDAPDMCNGTGTCYLDYCCGQHGWIVPGAHPGCSCSCQGSEIVLDCGVNCPEMRWNCGGS